MCLNPSRSRNSTATRFARRGASAMAWLTRSFKQHSVGQTGQKVMLRRVGHLQRHGPRRADIAKNDNRAGDPALHDRESVPPSLRWELHAIAPDQDAVRRQPDGPVLRTARSWGWPIVLRWSRPRDLENLVDWPAGGVEPGHPVIVSATGLR